MGNLFMSLFNQGRKVFNNQRLVGISRSMAYRQAIIDKVAASKSQRVMKAQRGANPETVKTRRFDRVRMATLKRNQKLGIRA